MLKMRGRQIGQYNPESGCIYN
ncbi:hypothetical protein BN1200_1110008 [Klebsiella variicola]|nr:hypothetical protein BN1200_1110008 [Klebsiella variicola]CTQ17947.1 hypothetical protein BN1200_1840004 [Klebsiella variicola]